MKAKSSPGNSGAFKPQSANGTNESKNLCRLRFGQRLSLQVQSPLRGQIEIRRVFDPSDFGPDVAENEQALRDEIAKRTLK